MSDGRKGKVPKAFVENKSSPALKSSTSLSSSKSSGKKSTGSTRLGTVIESKSTLDTPKTTSIRPKYTSEVQKVGATSNRPKTVAKANFKREGSKSTASVPKPKLTPTNLTPSTPGIGPEPSRSESETYQAPRSLIISKNARKSSPPRPKSIPPFKSSPKTVPKTGTKMSSDRSNPGSDLTIRPSGPVEAARLSTQETTGTKQWKIKVSPRVKNLNSPVTDLMENMKIKFNPKKSIIRLQLGDPCTYGNLQQDPAIEEAVIATIRSQKHNGYTSSRGLEAARKAIAKYFDPEGKCLTCDDVVITPGIHTAFYLSVGLLAEQGTTVLIPRPGNSHYPAYLQPNVKWNCYDLDPTKNWQIDIENLKMKIDETTSLIVINNPNNPTGAIFTLDNLTELLQVAEEAKIPILSDEIYGQMSFSGQDFVSLASIKSGVPRIITGGLDYRYLCPGWKVGWMVLVDPDNRFGNEIRQCVKSLSLRTESAISVVQGALPRLLFGTPTEFFTSTMALIQSNAEVCCAILATCPGMKPVRPAGSLFIMVQIKLNRFPDFVSTLMFVEKLAEEESVICFPGEAFLMPGYIRLVLTGPQEITTDACTRIKSFGERYYK